MHFKSETPNFKLLVTLPNNAEVGTRVSATYSSHIIRPERTERATKSNSILVNVFQPRRISLFAILQH